MPGAFAEEAPGLYPLPSRMKFFFLFLCVSLLLFSCARKEREDPRIAQLEKDVARLSDENKQLEQSINELRAGLGRPQTQQTAPQAQTTAASRVPMTVERMKGGVTPVLEEMIQKIKQASDTPKRGDGYGMRTEYDVSHAVFGLVQSKDSSAPYTARVIVKYEKFLESNKESRSYGSGSQEFRFVYRNQKWVYQKPQ